MRSIEKGITLVLGSGGARGLAHIGVLECLQEYGVPVRAVAGTSIGAFVGGLYASGMSAPDMVEVIASLDTLRITKILLPGLSSSALISTPSVRKFVAGLTGTARIEDLPIPFRAVATDLMTGEGVVLDRGPLVDAILASIAIPGLFQPVLSEGRYLIDGGLSNPVPVSVASGLAAGVTVAVDVTPNPCRLRTRIGEHIAKQNSRKRRVMPAWLTDALNAGRYPRLHRTLRRVPVRTKRQKPPYSPTAVRVSLQAISISAHNLIQLQLQRTPPDLLIDPAVEEFDMLEFHKGAEIIRCGYDAARAAMPALLRML